MKEFKSYKEHNERREQVLSDLYRLFEVLNKSQARLSTKKEPVYHDRKGDRAEKKILDSYFAVALSELSLATLIKEYDKLLD